MTTFSTRQTASSPSVRQAGTHSLTRMLGQLELHRVTGFLLTDCCAVGGVTSRRHVFHSDADDVTPSQFAVDG